MKKRISKIFSIFLALVMLVSNSPFALAKACNESVFPKAYNHASIKKCVSQSLVRKNYLNNNLLLASNQLDSNQSDPNIYNGESENEDNPSNENLEDTEKENVARSSFLRSEMVAKSHSSHHDDDYYKDIEVIKSWEGGNENHDPIKVELFKNYTVRIRYYNHRGQK